MHLFCDFRTKSVLYLYTVGHFFFSFFLHRAHMQKFLISQFILPPLLTFIMVIVNTVPLLNISFCWVAKRLGWGQFVPHCPIMPDACGYTIWSIHEFICILGHEFSYPLTAAAPQQIRGNNDLTADEKNKDLTAHLWEGGSECAKN